MKGNIGILSGNAGRPLAEKVCKELGIEPIKVNIQTFKDGETFVQILESIRDYDIYIINPTNQPDKNLIEMMWLIEAVRGASAKSITVIPTYLGYNRQERKDKPRIALGAALIIDMLKLPLGSANNRVMLLDLHSDATASQFRPYIVDHLYASYISIPYIIKNILNENLVIASPDKGGGPRAEAYAKRLGIDNYVLFVKSRPKPNVVLESSIKIIGDINGKDILFVDDMFDTCGTIIADAKAAKKAGAKNIYAFATHALFSDNAIDMLDKSPITEVITTDSIFHDLEELKTQRIKITVISIAGMIAEAITIIREGKSMNEIFI